MAKAQPNFLTNKPIGQDLFEGQSQEKIAAVISTIIKDKKFQIIGIDGAWGTGKSNLVEIIKKKVPDFTFFMYDVWGHQEDDQRKAILVELTELISSEKNTLTSNKGKWKIKLKKLLAKEKEVTTINRPYLSIGFILSLFLIIYTPTITFFSKENGEIFGIENKLGKVILLLFPLILIVIIYLFKVIYQLSLGSKIRAFEFALQQTFQVYTNKQEMETKIETISENEPSVKDFRNWMREIDDDLENRKLVLVFDNFDRLPKKNILSIWSSIHIFFAEEKYKNIKVIIPFDRLHIQNAFLESNGNQQNYANDYINKTFDLVYRVSPPILSSWKVFFETKWKEAFNDIDEEEFVRVLQIYEVYRNTITPREIIMCINEIVSIKLLDEKIPASYIALFVLNKEAIILDPLKAITEGEFLAGLSYLYKDEDDFQKFITALAYQINPENALEVVYKKQLKDSLVNKKIETFVEISKTNIFNKIIIPVFSELVNFENPIVVFDNLLAESKITDVVQKKIWNDTFLKVVNSFHDSFSIEEFQKVLLKHISIDESHKWINVIIEKLKAAENFDAVKFSILIDDLEEYVEANSIPIDIKNILSKSKIKNIDPELFTALVSYKNDKYKNYTLSTAEDELNDYLIKINAIGLETSNYIEYLTDFNLNLFESELLTKIESNKSDPNILGILYKRLKQISDKPIRKTLQDSEIYNLFLGLNETQDFYYDVIAMNLSKLNDFSNAYKPTFSVILNSDDDLIAEKIATRIEYYISYDKFLIGSITFNESILYKNVAKKIITNNYGTSTADIKLILVNFEKICSNVGISVDEFILDLNSFNFKEITRNDVIEFPLFLFESLMKNETKLSHHLLKLANDYFFSLSKEKWEIIFKSFEKFEFSLLKSINFQKWNSFSTEGFRNVLIDIILNRNFNQIDEWQYLLESFKKSGVSLTNTLKDIRDKIYSDSTFVNKDLFLLFVNPFFENSILDEKPGDSFRTFFKTEFLDDGDIIQVLIKNSAKIKDLMNKCSVEEIADYKQAIADRKTSNDRIEELFNLIFK